MPRSPTSTTLFRPNCLRSLLAWLLTVLGSATLPANTSQLIGRPCSSQS